jgi:hypothetical protein
MEFIIMELHITKLNILLTNIINNLNKNKYYSISVDYNKNNIKKIGIYGLLY